MSAFGILNIIVAALELCVPSYALRLVRRFGAAQVGTFVVIAFAALALLHAVNPIKVGLPGSGLALTAVYGGASVLLLIGMGHTETVCRQRQQIQIEEEKLRLQLDAEAKERAEDLTKIQQGMAQEIVRLQQQLESLTATEKQYRLLYAQNPNPMWVFDLRGGKILSGNEAALTQFGYTEQEFRSLNAKDLVAREASKAFSSDLARPCSGLESRGAWRYRRKDRTWVDVEVMALDLRFGDCPARLMFTEDVGPRLMREAELCELQRTRILRKMAEGVAHHFGQILTVVEGQTGLLGDGVDGSPATEHYQQVLAETRRGTALIRQLLAVGGCEGIQLEPVDLNDFIQGEENLLRKLVGERIDFELHLGEGLAPVLVDGRILELILVNLILNARGSLPHGGSIDVSTQPAWVENQQASPLLSAHSGHFIQLTVRDNGCGMTPEVQEHVFEPFFTTRQDKAMGLGLATIYGSVKQHGGWVEFTSQQGHGTEFRVFLPVAQLNTQSEAAQESATAQESGETVLLVEANDRVRDLARHILNRNGYHVIEADGPATASLLMESQAKNVHLLLTNLNYANGSSGRDLAMQLREVNPKLKVIYSTGPLAPEDNESDLLKEATLLLQPYTPDRLLQTIATCLGITPQPKADNRVTPGRPASAGSVEPARNCTT